MIALQDSIAGVILGTAVGDAVGLVREGLSRRRARRMFGDPPVRPRLLFGRGMVSDDTEHTCLVAQALHCHSTDSERFAAALAWGLRFWFLGLPAGIGKATLRATLKLWLGFSPNRSGVWSAGNGPAMRSAILGVCFQRDPERLRSFVRANSRFTHTDPRAERGALLIALAARHGVERGPDRCEASTYLTEARSALADQDAPLSQLLDRIEEHLIRNAPASELADALGLQRGVSGYVYHTVPLALYCWLRQPGNFRAAVEEVICLGGDADTTGAITGALAGAGLGPAAIPGEWLNSLIEWPRSISWMRSLAASLSEQFGNGNGKKPVSVPNYFWPGVLPRNLFFLTLVLLHGFRRLLPPY